MVFLEKIKHSKAKGDDGTDFNGLLAVINVEDAQYVHSPSVGIHSVRLRY